MSACGGYDDRAPDYSWTHLMTVMTIRRPCHEHTGWSWWALICLFMNAPGGLHAYSRPSCPSPLLLCEALEWEHDFPPDHEKNYMLKLFINYSLLMTSVLTRAQITKGTLDNYLMILIQGSFLLNCTDGCNSRIISWMRTWFSAWSWK